MLRARPFGSEPRQLFTIDGDHRLALLEEADEALDLGTLGNGIAIAPGEVAMDLSTGFDAPIRSEAFVGAARRGVALYQQIAPDIFERDIIAHRMPRLEHERRAFSVGDRLACDRDLHAERAPDRADALVGVARLNENLLVLLVPRVHGVPLEGEMVFDPRAGGRRVGIAPGGVFDRLGIGAQRP